MADDEPRGVHLSDKQLVFVFMSATVAAVVVFLLGVFVGRGVQQARGPVADGGMTAAAEVVPDGPPAEAPVADGAPRPASGGTGGDDLSYPERLGKTPPAEALKPAPSPVGGSSGGTAPPEVPAEPLAPSPAAAKPAPAVAATPSTAAPWTVQVAAVKRRDEADAMVKRLKTQGLRRLRVRAGERRRASADSASGSGRSRTSIRPRCSRSVCFAKRSDTSPGLPASRSLRRPAGSQLSAVRPPSRRVGRIVSAARGADAPGGSAAAPRLRARTRDRRPVLRRHAVLDTGRASNIRGISLPLAVAAGGLLVAYLALFPALVAVVVARVCGRIGPAGVLVTPAVWVAAELARRWVLGGFPWVLLGSSQAGVTAVVQTASLAGVYGLSALVAFVSAAIALGVAGRGRARWAAPAAAACLVGGLAGWGAWRVHDGSLLRGGQSVRVALVQGNVLQNEKWDKERATAILSRYLTMTREGAARGASLIVWPESSTPFMFEHDPVGRSAITGLAQELGVAMLFGSDQYEPGKPPRFYNSAFLVGPDGQTNAVYRKMHLVPFGEYVPLKRLLFFVAPLVESVSDFSPGEEHVVLPLGAHRLSTAICYEVVYPDLVAASTRRGSQLLTTITNDAWYGHSSAPHQHFWQATCAPSSRGGIWCGRPTPASAASSIRTAACSCRRRSSSRPSPPARCGTSTGRRSTPGPATRSRTPAAWSPCWPGGWGAERQGVAWRGNIGEVP